MNIFLFIRRQTQEYKLQFKLINTLPEVIQDLNIDDKHLFLMAETVSIYLDKDQLSTLQQLAKQFYIRLFAFNSPLIYGILKARSHIDNYAINIQELLNTF